MGTLSGKLMRSQLEQMKGITIEEPSITLLSALKESQMEDLIQLADVLATDIKSNI